jgi:hypothetical protein
LGDVPNIGLIVGADVAEALVVGFEGDDLVGADVAEALVAGFEGDDLVGADVAEALVVWTESHLGHA